MDDEGARSLSAHVAREIRAMCEKVCGRRVDRGFGVLVAGLGNSDITPDAIGPDSVRKLNVTRHLRALDEALYDTVGRCEISAVFPGVLGQTGIETVELIRGAAENARPDVVLAIDALAARSCERLAATVQLSDSGIHPGSGIGNNRKAICHETVGVPVIALGVPTVVDSSTLVYDALRRAGIEDVRPELRQVLENGRSFFVSPKESDVITERVSDLIADAVDTAFTLAE
jgi:spore protease